jgi:hypothetical protein
MISIYVTDAYGWRIAEVTRYATLECTTGLNTRGWFTLTFAAQDFPAALFMSSGAFAIDRRIEVWRTPAGRAARLVFCGLVRVYEEDAPDYAYTEDYSEEGTFCYAAGRGTESSRTVTDAENSARLRASPLNRREIFYQNSNTDDTNVLSDGARGELYEKRPKLDFSPKNIEFNYLYPHDWNMGDVLRISTGMPETVAVCGPDLNELLERRVIAYKTGSAEAHKSQAADDMLKSYVYENLGAGVTDPARQLPAALGFEIAADITLAPVVDYSATYGNLLDTLKRVAERATENGTQLFFGVLPVWAGGRVVPRFETQVNMWGRDRTNLSIGTGALAMNMTVTGVHLKADRNGETIIPRVAQVEDK